MIITRLFDSRTVQQPFVNLLFSFAIRDTLASKCKTSAECTGKGEYCNRSSGKCWCLPTHFVLGKECKPVIYPGQNGCEDSRQCAKGYPGAICTTQNKCQCPKGFRAKAFSCFKNKRYAPQRKRSQPLGMSAYDYNGFAEKAKYDHFDIPAVHEKAISSLCPAQQVFIHETGISRLPGQSCQYSEQCAAIEPGTFCRKLRCKCARGMKLNGNSCTFMEPKCAIYGHVWIPEMGQCMQGTISSQTANKANNGVEQMLSPGVNGCSHSIQCSAAADGAYCSQHKCTCPEKLVPIDGICGEQCQANMTFSAVVGKCISAIKPGGKCQYSSQCQTSDAEIICIRGICRCSLGKVFIGDRCAENCPADHVVGNNGICRQVTSACPMGSERCLSGSSCLYGSCGCPFGTLPKSGECILERKVPIGSPCNSTQICLENANCIDGICQCPVGMVVQDGKCRNFMLTGVGASCANGEFCSGGSTCTKSICLCPAGTTNQNGVCKEDQNENYEKTCINGETCYGDLFCIDGICQCPQGTFSSDGQCIPTTGKCSNPLQCEGNSYCDHNIGLCVCQDGHQYRDQSCISMFSRTLISPIKICITNTDCIAGAKCIASRCHCPAGEIFTDGRCQMVFAEPGESCLNGETCVSNYVCINGSCLCPDGEISKDGNCVTEDTEIKKHTSYQAEPNSPCSRGELCIGGSFCSVVDRICRCPADSILQNGRCKFINGISLL
uniref:EB domain-containing protein n=1 Tax=Loa loa TaxID=7209 RepID=A0A1I7V7K2_LOALO